MGAFVLIHVREDNCLFSFKLECVLLISVARKIKSDESTPFMVITDD